MNSNPEEHLPHLIGGDDKRIPLCSPCEIGRSEDCAISLSDSQVSRHHCILQQDSRKQWWITDQESTNGTYVNGRRVTQATQLDDHDTLTIGNQHFIFRGPPREGATEEAPVDIAPQGTTINFSQIECWLLVGDIISSTLMSRDQAPEELNKLIGEWGDACRKVIEQYQGEINKFLGDGYFAFWRGDAISGETMPHLLKDLHRLRERMDVPFRLILHYGHVQLGGMMTRGEENLSGSAVNFVFKAEKVASELGETIFISDAAAAKLKGSTLSTVGVHSVPGFPGENAFFTMKCD